MCTSTRVFWVIKAPCRRSSLVFITSCSCLKAMDRVLRLLSYAVEFIVPACSPQQAAGMLAWFFLVHSPMTMLQCLRFFMLPLVGWLTD